MIRRLRNYLGRFARSETGQSTVEFAITFPAMFFIVLSAVDLGMVTLQYSSLERAVDQTVRDIRLGTGNAPQHDEIKTMICDRAGFIDNCSTNLRLEMVELDPRAYVAPDPNPDCTDQSAPVRPVRSFVNGLQNDMMLLRVCAKIDPVFPTVGLGKNIEKDGNGQFRLLANAAFVQEPR